MLKIAQSEETIGNSVPVSKIKLLKIISHFSSIKIILC